MLSVNHKMQDYKICVAVIATVSGVRGHVKLQTFTANPKDIGSFSELYDQDDNIFKLKIISVKKQDSVIAAIEGINSRDEAEKLRNSKLYIFRSSLPEVEQDEYYHADLYNMDVYFTNGEKIGFVENIENFGAGDIIEVRTSNDKSVYYSFSKQFVVEVNMEKRYISIQQPEQILAVP